MDEKNISGKDFDEINVSGIDSNEKDVEEFDENQMDVIEENTEENVEEYDDFNELLLQLNDDTNNIKEISELDVVNEKEIDLPAYIAKNKWHVYKEIAKIFTERSKNDNSLKERYSIILVGILVLQLVVMNIVFILRGADVLVFSDTTFNMFITSTIAEVFALITVIVKYLFTDNLTKLLSNILTDVKEEIK